MFQSQYKRLDVGQIGAILTRLGGMNGVTDFLRGVTDVVERKHEINLDADPYIPDGGTVVRHDKHGTVQWFPSNMELRPGNKPFTWETRSFWNATLLDWLLRRDNQQFIPTAWRYTPSGEPRRIYFLGTQYGYQDESEGRVSRYMEWSERSGTWVAGTIRSELGLGYGPNDYLATIRDKDHPV